MKKIRNLLKLLKQKKTLIDEINFLREMAHANIEGLIHKIKALDQNKVYTIQMERSTPKQVKMFKASMERAKETIPWTIPYIIILTEPIQEWSKEDLQKLIEESDTTHG